VEDFHVYTPLIFVCNSERMAKIGAELPKLSQNKYGYPFFGPRCIYCQCGQLTRVSINPILRAYLVILLVITYCIYFCNKMNVVVVVAIRCML